MQLSTDHYLVEGPPANGQEIVDRWNTRGRLLQKLSKRPTAAGQAVPPVAAVPVALPPVAADAEVPIVPAPLTVTVTPIVSPPQSPLAELSPRFANNNDPIADQSLSPTYGQLRFIEDQLNAPWRFASVPFQTEPAAKSVYKFVRPNADGVIEEVRSELGSHKILLTSTPASRH